MLPVFDVIMMVGTDSSFRPGSMLLYVDLLLKKKTSVASGPKMWTRYDFLRTPSLTFPVTKGMLSEIS